MGLEYTATKNTVVEGQLKHLCDREGEFIIDLLIAKKN